MVKPIFIKAVDTKEGILIRTREDGKSIIKEYPFKNYFFVEPKTFKKEGWLIKKYASNYKEVKSENGEFVKIILKDNFKRYYAKKVIEDRGYKTFEADITASKRYLLDHSDKYDFTGYKICYLDFESDDRNPLGRNFDGSIKFGEEQITGVAIMDTQGNEFFFRNENADNHLDAKEEAELIKNLLYVLKDYDIVSAFAGNWFDFELLKHRIKEHKDKYDRELGNIFNLKLINKVDFQDLYKKYVYWAKHDSYSLNSIANDDLSDGKVDWSDKVTGEGLGRYYKLYKEYPDTFKEYNIKDVKIMKLLDEKFHLFKIHDIVSNRVKNTPEECMFNSHMVDTFLIRLEHSQGIVCDSKPTEKEIEERKLINIGGGHIECLRGIYKNILTYDFKSHYPLVVSTWNISPETFVSTHPVDLEEVKDKFSEKEFEFLEIVNDQRLNEKEIKKWLEENKINGLDVAMKFNRYYEGNQAKKYAEDNDLLLTPADLNKSKVGWFLHSHRLFKNPKNNEDMGNLVRYMGGAVDERDKVKYLQKRKRKEDSNFEGTQEDEQYNAQSNALKVIANSVTWDTLVPVKNIKTGWEGIMKIADLENCWKQYETLVNVPDTSKYEWKKIIGFLKEKPKDGITYNIKTQFGYEVECSSDHSFYIYDEAKKKEVELKGENAKEGDLMVIIDEVFNTDKNSDLKEINLLYYKKLLESKKFNRYFFNDIKNNFSIRNFGRKYSVAVKKLSKKNIGEVVEEQMGGGLLHFLLSTKCLAKEKNNIIVKNKDVIELLEVFVKGDITKNPMIKDYEIPQRFLEKLSNNKYFLKNTVVRGTFLGKRNSLPLIFPIKDSFIELLGFYISEGSIHKTNCRIELTQQKETKKGEAYNYFDNVINKFKKDYSDIFGKDMTFITKFTKGWYVSNKILNLLFVELCGKKCSNIHLPQFYPYLSKKQLDKLIHSIFMGDGNYMKNVKTKIKTGKRRFSSKSMRLIDELGSVMKNIRYSKDGGVYRINELSDKTNEYVKKIGNKRYLPITSVEKNKMEGDEARDHVYDLTVEDYYDFIGGRRGWARLKDSGYGFTGFRSTRYFKYDIADAITTCARWLIKKAINKSIDEGFTVVNTHTDSIYITKNGEEIDPKIMNNIFYDLYRGIFKNHISRRQFKLTNPHTGKEVIDNYWTVFEFEDKIDSIITSAKARYYYLTDDKVKTQGGAFKRSEVNPLAKKIQKELCGDLLRDKFDKDYWINKLKDLKEKVYSNKLEEEFVVMRKIYQRHHSEFGKPMIDKKTGEQKVSKDGSLRCANIPCHIKLVKRIEESKEGYSFPIGDTIKYVIGKPNLIDLKPVSRKSVDKEKFQKIYDEYKDYGLNLISIELKNAGVEFKEVFDRVQRAISIEEWENGELYDKEHYWEMIVKPVAEILSIVFPKTYFIDFGDLIGLSERKIKNLIEQLEKNSNV